MNKKKTIARHRKMWIIIAEKLEKEEFIDKKEIYKKCGGGSSQIDGFLCFCCTYSWDQCEEKGIIPIGCNFCPLTPSSNKFDIKRCLNGLYYEYLGAEGDEKIELAKKISNLPEASLN